MSKYTTEVRYICEHYAGLEESTGYEDIDEIIASARDKIFDSDYPIFNAEYKPILETKILKHYYTREIGAESVALWKLWLNNRMNEIMPYYNKLYESELLEYNPLQNIDVTNVHSGEHDIRKQNIVNVTDDHTETRNLKEEKDYTETRNLTETNDYTDTRNLTTTDDGSSSFNKTEDTTLRHDKTITRGDDTVEQDDDVTKHDDDTNKHEIDSNLDHWTLFSDTPQGGITGVENGGGVSTSSLSSNAYLTNATHVTESPAETTDTITHGDITNQHGKITNSYGTVVETYNKTDDKADSFESEGWNKNDNTNTQTGTVRNAGSTENTGTIRNAGATDNTGTIRKAGTTSDIGSQTDAGTDNYTNTQNGKIGVITYQEMVKKWRETFINIDKKVIDELSDLFMTVW